MNEVVKLKGKVFSGTGKGALFVTLSWVRKQFVDKLGFTPYPGTLNLRLPSKNNRKVLDEEKGIGIEPEEGFCHGKCFKAIIANRIEGTVLIPGVPGYPLDVVEILAPVYLREKLGLKDGDEVEVTIQLAE
ncbi:MAG: DUF120 domain-containing protein [Thermoproteota archaeon]